jgi:hypothetical protein
MMTRHPHIIEELEAYLDSQQAQVEQTLGDLDELRSAVVRRDHGALEQLQAHIRRETHRRTQAEADQQRLRIRLSEWLHCSVEAVNVSRVCEHLDGRQRRAIQTRQQQLQARVRKLQNEHQATELMLRECARFNRVLLSGLIGTNNQTRTYTGQGKEHWNVHRGLMNIKM